MQKLYSLEVRGKRYEWCIHVMADPKHVEDWQADGVKIFEVVNIIPQWWVDMGFSVRLWCFVQDLLNFKNPFAG